MDKSLVSTTQKELMEEMIRLSESYQRSYLDATKEYEAGIIRAQIKYTKTMNDILHSDIPDEKPTTS